jgi:hypothetical protein
VIGFRQYDLIEKGNEMNAKSGLLLPVAWMAFNLFVSDFPACAQNINITTPLQTFHESGFSSVGGGRLNLNGRRLDGSRFSLGFNFAQGSNRSSITTAPSLTVQNGYGGSLFSGQIRPFVTGFVPVVGNQAFVPMSVDNAVTRALNSGQLDLRSPAPPSASRPYSRSYQQSPDNSNTLPSSATRGDASVESIKAQRAGTIEARRQKLNEKLAEARSLVAQDERSLARSSFRRALTFTDDPSEKRRIKSEIEATRD